MSDREELQALRRMAELEAKAGGDVQARMARAGIDPNQYKPTDVPWYENLLAGAGKSFVDTGRGVGQLAGVVPQAAVDEAAATDKPLMSTGAGVAGNVLGGIAQTVALPGASTVGGAALASALLAGAQPVETGGSRVLNTVIGGGAGAGGAAAGKVIGKALTGPANVLTDAERELARKAAEQGINLSPGQATGNKFLRTLESQMERMPATASSATEGRLAQGEQYTRALSRQMGEDTGDIGEAVMRAKPRIGAEYERIFANAQIGVADDTLAQLAAVSEKANKLLPTDKAKVVANHIDEILGKVGEDGSVPGKAYQKWRSTVRSSDGDTNFYLKQVRSVMDDAAKAAMGEGDAAAHKVADAQYKAMKTLQPLAEKSTNGQVSPGLVLERVRQGYPGMAFGNAGEMGDLAKIGKAFVKDSTADSGTSQRMLAQALLQGGMGTGVGAGTYMATGDAEKALKAGGATIAGQLLAPKLAQALLNRPGVARYLAEGGIDPANVNPLLIEMLKRGSGAAPAAVSRSLISR